MTTDEAIDLCKHNSEAWAARAARNGDAEDAADAEAIRVILAENARLAARVAELEAIADCAERLAASVATHYVDTRGIASTDDIIHWASRKPPGDTELAAVRAVTRAATTDDAPPHATEGEGTP